jgi:hypothetical protein
MAKIIRQTSSWNNYKKYFEKLLNGAHAKYCGSANPVEEEQGSFCSQLISRIDTLNNIAAEHCKEKEKGCRKYCEKYCNHFVDMSTSEYYPSCPKESESNKSDENLSADEDIEEYLNFFAEGKNCREQET